MLTDIAIPKGNEAEFIEIASKLGIRKLYFLYDFDEFQQEAIQKNLSQIENNIGINIEAGFIVTQKNISKALSRSKLLVAKSSDNDRLFIESKKIRLIYGFEELQRKDYLHQRASGLNHTLCELASKNDVAIGFSYSPLFNKDKKASALLIGRMIQNIALCQKYKAKIVIGSFSQNPFHLRSPHDIKSMFEVFGMGGKTIKESYQKYL